VTALVLDVGKTNVRLVAIDEPGNALEQLSRPNLVRAGPPYPHFDVEEIFAWLVAGIRSLARNHEVSEIVPVAHGACAALLADDTLALPILDYEFAGPEELLDYDAEARRFAETFSPRLPAGLNLGRQLAWLRTRFPTEFARAHRALPLSQYWAWRLCGVAASEVTSLGCHTDLWAPARRAFSELARAQRMDGLFAPMRAAWHRLGPLRPEITERTGVSGECRVLTGIHDSNASYLAHRGARDGAFAVVSSGTWTIMMARHGDLAALDEARDSLANVDAFGEPVATARFMGGREYAAIAGEQGALLEVGEKEVLASITRRDLVLPAFAPGVGPFPARTGSIVLADRTDARARAAAAALYCALVTDVCLELVGARGDVIVEGPFARNVALLFALAALRPSQRVLASPDETGTLGGAAQLVARSRGARIAVDAGEPAVACDLGARRLLAAHRERWRAALR
jgi:sugar (pentulose or hexulose) kinase